MAEESTHSASEENQSGSGEPQAGGSVDGGAGTQSSADAFAGERESLSKQARDFQSARDRERARAEAAERKLAELQAAASPAESAPASLTMADLVRYDQLKDARDALRSEYPDADPSIFARAIEFDSPEALRATVERSHNGRKEYRERIEREAEERAREILRSQGIKVEDPAPATSGTTPVSGDPTPAELQNTPFQEWEARGWTDEVVDRVLAKANPEALLRMGGGEA